MKAKPFLLQVQKLDAMIENKRDERMQLYLLATNTTAGAAPDTGVRVKSSGNQQRMASTIESVVDMEAEIEGMIRFLFDAKNQIISVIEELETEEYNLLHSMYIGKVLNDNRKTRIKYLTLQEAADDADKSYSWARGVHGRALVKVQKIIDREKMEPAEKQFKRWKKEKSGKM